MNEFLAPINEMGLPAPIWFLKLFKVLGFVLHLCMMNLWYAGMPLAAILSLTAEGDTRRIGERMVMYMPIIVALGINFGIVPLLFIQTLHYSLYYPTGILIAWPWLSVIVLLMFAYYGVYIYTTQVKNNNITKIGKISVWISAVFFILIGFLFANNFSLLVNKDEWLRIYEQTNVAGAVTGFALNLQDASLLPRWLFMIGLSVMTTAVYLIIDSVFFAKNETDNYRNTVRKFSLKLYLVGLIWAGTTSAWYIFGTFSRDLLDAIKTDPIVHGLFVITGLSAIVPLVIMIIKKQNFTKATAWLLGGFQFLVLTFNALSRQWVQDFSIAKIVDLNRELVVTQWSSMIPFLLTFVIGAAVIFWMLKKIVGLKSMS